MPSPARSDADLAIGRRVREQRARRQMSQTQLASASRLSGSYISLIEAGRRTATPQALERIAAVLDCSAQYLRTGRGGPDGTELELDLRFAEMALRAGDGEAASERFANVVAAARERGLREVEVEARWGLARATEAVGALESAIGEYEALASEQQLPATIDRTVVLTALCRGYHECGDLSRAVDVGEQALGAIEQSGETAALDDAAIALASTLAGCYLERGDLTRAHGVAQGALSRAQQNGSPQARAAALWNAGLISEARGDLRTARSYVERALALYGETDNVRATALLRVAAAWILLRQPERDVSEAEVLLAQALDDLPVVGSDLDLAYAQTELARCRLLRGEWGAAIDMTKAVISRLKDHGTRLEASAARLLLADAYFVSGDTDAAIECYTRAAEEMRASGARRQAASAWRELAEGLANLGRTTEALDAYRAASDAVGVPAPTPHVATANRSDPGDANSEMRTHRPPQPSPR